MIKGNKYHITLRDGRWFVGRYCGVNYAGYQIFDLRPAAGTIIIPDSQIRSHEPRYRDKVTIGSLGR